MGRKSRPQYQRAREDDNLQHKVREEQPHICGKTPQPIIQMQHTTQCGKLDASCRPLDWSDASIAGGANQHYLAHYKQIENQTFYEEMRDASYEWIVLCDKTDSKMQMIQGRWNNCQIL